MGKTYVNRLARVLWRPRQLERLWLAERSIQADLASLVRIRLIMMNINN